MLEASSELKSFISDKKTEYNLYFDDYGKGSIIICSERGNVVEWEVKNIF